MDRKNDRAEGEEEEEEGVLLVPAGAIGFLLYPWAVKLILEVPPANDVAPRG